MAAKKIKVEVVRETAKALLVSANGQQGWIQKRWMDASGMVSETTFTKAVESNQARQVARDDQREAEAAEKLFRNSDHAVRVARETEKAVAATITIEFAGCETEKLVWFPKSAIGGGDGVAVVPGWMIRAKIAEALEGPQGSDYYSRHRFCKGEVAYLVRGVEILETVSA